MKCTFLVLFFSSLSIFVTSQELEGRYTNYNDSISFNNGHAELNIQSEGGFTYTMRGMGKYNIYSDYLIINNSKHKSDSIISTIEKKVNHDVNKENIGFMEQLEIGQVIEEEKIIFRIISNQNDSLLLRLLPFGEVGKIFTVDYLRSLEEKSKKLDFRIRALKKE